MKNNEASVGSLAVDAAASSERASALTSVRLLSLDVFRGLTIAAMLLVNNPGSWQHIYAPLEHAAWNGWTPTDLIFPFFVFIVGVAMTYSLGKAREHGSSRRDLLLKTAKRALSIFLVGLALQSFPWWGYDYAHLRIPGVLQRIAIAYLFAATIYLHTGVRGQVSVIVALLLGYWALQALIPVPGASAVVLEPGRDLGAYLDRAIFTTNHLWHSTQIWDPEGLLSTLPAIATALLGGIAGTWMRSDRAPLEKIAGLFVVGSAGVVLGLIWGGLFPINKNLWTSSYVLFTAGLAAHFLAVCYYLIDVKGYRQWTKPFVIFGSNAIAAYVLSSLGSLTLDLIKVGEDDASLKTYIFKSFYTSWLQPIDASLLFAISYVLLWLAIMSVFYRKKLFVKL
jgi:predicted acyltransferase